MKVPISKIGETQKLDIEKSSGLVYFDEYARICTVVKPQNVHDDRGDKVPFRMSKLFGGNWQDYNNHFIIQCAACPLKCPFCYVDNIKADTLMDAAEIVDRFVKFKEVAEPKFNIKLKVLHFMGGDPAIYADFWVELREELDRRGLNDTILFSDVVMVENHLYNNKPWNNLDLKNFILTGCLKGTTRENFLENSGGVDLFDVALSELREYVPYKNFYLTLIGQDEDHEEDIYKIIPKDRVDKLTIINYEVTKQKSNVAVK